eukprot:14782819-Heterocapsa_arctica.AAC.1
MTFTSRTRFSFSTGVMLLRVFSSTLTTRCLLRLAVRLPPGSCSADTSSRRRDSPARCSGPTPLPWHWGA